LWLISKGIALDFGERIAGITISIENSHVEFEAYLLSKSKEKSALFVKYKQKYQWIMTNSRRFFQNTRE